MTKVDFFGHSFYFFLFVGMLLLQAKDYRGWAFRFAGEIGWIGIGFYLGMSSIWLWGFAFMAVDVLGYFKWQKEQKELAEIEAEAEKIQDMWQPIKDADLTTEQDVIDYVGRVMEANGYVKTYEKPPYAGVHDPIFCKQNGIEHGPESTCVYCWDYLAEVKANGKNKDKQRKAEGKKISARSSKADNRKVPTGRGGRSKPSDGKRRSRSNDEPRRKKSVPRKRGVQKNSSRPRAQGSRASKV